MGLIRSGNTELTPMSDNDALTKYLWPIVCEMIKTVIENRQSLLFKDVIFLLTGRKISQKNIWII